MKLEAFQAAHSYGLAKSTLKPEATAARGPAATDAAFEALHAMAGAVAKGERTAIDFMTGGADPHSVVEALAAAELAIETATTVRDKVVEAYQELLRMPV
ncbi:MAG: flagellar hook-basal body complex protein FliE [Parvularculaceae bacterium]|nr:flagellar hook-basal body complex protein FliE [Parvularculaceae bacterium]